MLALNFHLPFLRAFPTINSRGPSSLWTSAPQSLAKRPRAPVPPKDLYCGPSPPHHVSARVVPTAKLNSTHEAYVVMDRTRFCETDIFLEDTSAFRDVNSSYRTFSPISLLSIYCRLLRREKSLWTFINH